MKICTFVCLFLVLLFNCKNNDSDSKNKHPLNQYDRNQKQIQQPIQRSNIAYTKAKDFTLPDINGKNVSLKDFVGKKVVFINFWAHWCLPCHREIPVLINLQKKFKDNLQIVSIAVSSKKGPIKQIIKRYKINYPVLWESAKKQVASAYAVRAFPTSVVLNKKGEIISTVIGGRSYKQLEAIINKALKS